MQSPITKRERARFALSHQAPDYVPLDIGGTHDSTCLTGSYQDLCWYFGITGNPRIANRWLGSVWLDDSLLEKLEVDFHYLAIPAPDYPVQNYSDGSSVFQDEWGLLWKKPARRFYYDVFQI